VDPPLLEGSEAVQAVQSTREPGVELHGPNRSEKYTDPVWVIDGRIVDDETMKRLDQNMALIESVRVFKGDQAIARFGAEAENGVVEITLKEPLETLVTPPDTGR
jgi:hypothetical protein